ncbi:testicular haploid expressed gene protein-like [Patella vulgata]|uniref:testicular haploid expressed gene protein-like n=1 Tax=Patella vulgata TaxID=6465 RepID=UPI0024A8CEBB|nr:testicular haploid expressed gene protein-like [Patella vulgata]
MLPRISLNISKLKKLFLYPNRAQFFYSCGRTSPLTVPEKVQGAERPRTTMLAAHKSPHLTAREIQTIIPPPALKAKTSERVEALAHPKDRPVGPYRESQWIVSESAKNAAASTRSMELARPKGLVEGYLPHKETLWPVTRAARRATATNRLNELSQPTVRNSMDHLQFNPEAFIVKPTALKGTCPRRVDELSQPIQR